MLFLAEYLSKWIRFVHAADRLFTRGDKVLREQKLWNDVRNVFDKICKETDCVMSVPAKRFIGHIGHFAVDKLEGFPDNWCWNKKACYLFSIISADSSKVRSALQKLKFDWPKGKTGAIHPILRKVIDYEKSKRHPTLYDEEDGYDYLRLCRNIVKHWISLCKSVKFLQVLEDIHRTMHILFAPCFRLVVFQFPF